ncbi:MAG: hypothetical protein HPY82_21155 [Gammaproteobacteria bacterium]|nr:hypothetical protein [Gammaproteobacteria bacterium]
MVFDFVHENRAPAVVRLPESKKNKLTPKGENRNRAGPAARFMTFFLLYIKQPDKELLTARPLPLAGCGQGKQNGELQTVKKLKNWGCEIRVAD